MDQERTAEALLVEDSRIPACGSCSEVAPLADGADLVDLHGAALMPAFIDGHSHITALAQTMGLVQLNGAESLRDIGERASAGTPHSVRRTGSSVSVTIRTFWTKSVILPQLSWI